MKKLLKISSGFAAFALLFLAACHSASDKIVSFIPGTYVHAAKGEYSQAEDTLVITLVSGKAYNIQRRVGFRPIRDGKLLPKRWKVQSLNGNYDPQRQVLFETSNGRAFSFDPVKGVLLVNSAVYRKL
ncbi:hypothetical protein [Mucilaginibacter sp. OK098]|uniref:hypothetical protein n=1 Tax=Mucilaginibacter sp. OK098 TaxID=1855297 RepID=UPI00091504F1|nr:hypothetical protein [Mucilaginibacter sp. OK098]SHL96851.1 hypothetical protein SAMN05216524_101358 [Mucilaginibacter sp. OK098]